MRSHIAHFVTIQKGNLTDQYAKFTTIIQEWSNSITWAANARNNLHILYTGGQHEHDILAANTCIANDLTCLCNQIKIGVCGQLR
ncbi:hypothetical protein NBRC3222_2008 [Acetobacter pasteurianus NBRC 3222]|nr:hypothetical protein NBRC3222_2008 [Acetobacter pasteurianus NBRC 3222]